MNTLELRCGHCDYWLGESAVDLFHVDSVPKSPREIEGELIDRTWADVVREDVTIQRPRDLRLCKSCNHMNVFIAKAHLDVHRQDPVGCR